MKRVFVTQARTWIVAAALCCVASSTMAQAPATEGEVFVVLAKTEAGTIDPSLRSVTALREPPFNTYQSMQVLTRNTVSLQVSPAGQPEVPASISLPNGRTLQLVLLERMSDGRFKVRVSINMPGKRDYLPLLTVMASAGEPFFVAGQKHDGGLLVIGVVVGKRAVAAH